MFETLLIIFEQASFFIFLGLGAYISFSLMKVPDLSIESAYVFGAILASKSLGVLQGFSTGVNLLCVIVASMVGGLCVGLVSSLLTKQVKLPHLLSSILTIGLFHGISQFVLGTSNVSLSKFDNPLVIKVFSYEFFSQNNDLPIVFFLGIVFVMLGYFFLKSQLGLCLAVYGNNPEFFQHHRISDKFVFVFGLMISNTLAGLSGYLVAQSNGFIDVNAGHGIALFCITFLILGKAIKRKKYFSFLVPVIGLVAYCTLQQVILKVGFNLKYFTMVQSIIVILLLMHTYKNKSKYDVKDNLGI